MTAVIVNPVQPNQVFLEENENIVIVEAPVNIITTVVAHGPQGPQGTAGSGIVVNDSAKVDRSIVYYDAITNGFKADNTWTLSTLTDGGNF